MFEHRKPDVLFIKVLTRFGPGRAGTEEFVPEHLLSSNGFFVNFI
mgnify:CR=1 FL=1